MFLHTPLFPPFQLPPDGSVESVLLSAQKTHFLFVIRDHDVVAAEERMVDLTVEGETQGEVLEFALPREDFYGDLVISRNDEGLLGKGVRADGSEDGGLERRMDDRPAGGEVIGRGTGRRCDDDAVRTVLGERGTVDARLEIDEPRDRSLMDDNLVEDVAIQDRSPPLRGFTSSTPPATP